MVLERGRYGPGRQYLIRLADGGIRMLELDSVLDKGEGWIKASYRPLA